MAIRSLACSALMAGLLAAHEIPAGIVAHMLVKAPNAGKVEVLVRVPLKAVRDVEFPEQGATGYLDLDKLRPLLPGLAAQWLGNPVALHADQASLGQPRIVATQISLASDRSFVSFDTARAHVTAPPLANNANVTWNQVWFDALLEFSGAPAAARLSIRPGLERLAERVTTTLVFVPAGGAPTRLYEITGDAGLVALDPRWHQAFARFLRLGFEHILAGADHLLFLFCLVIPFRRLRPLAIVVTAFTLAHSITLACSAYGLAPGALWFPPLIETAIAASIVYMALENIVGASRAGRRWAMAFGFGLVHGFGFSFALRETLPFAGDHLVSALVAFNAGVELGQLLALALLTPLLHLVFRYVVEERIGMIVLSALVAHTGWHWLLERGEALWQYRFELPSLGDAASLLRWLALALLVAGLIRWRLNRAAAMR